jgi:hypothetical protein
VTVTFSQSLYSRSSVGLSGTPRKRSFISQPSYFPTTTNFASALDILRSFGTAHSQRVYRCAAGGLVAGLAGSFALMSLVRSLLFGIRAADPIVMTTAAAVFHHRGPHRGRASRQPRGCH